MTLDPPNSLGSNGYNHLTPDAGDTTVLNGRARKVASDGRGLPALFMPLSNQWAVSGNKGESQSGGAWKSTHISTDVHQGLQRPRTGAEEGLKADSGRSTAMGRGQSGAALSGCNDS